MALVSRMKPFSLILLLLSCFFPTISSAEKILFLLPISTKSMANVFEPLAISLAERHHHLTIFTPSPFIIPVDHPNVTQSSIITVADYNRNYPDPFEVRRENKLFRFPLEFQQNFCHKLYSTPEFISLANQKFDLIIANIIYHDCFAGLMYKIGAPIIFVASLPLPSPMTELYGTWQPSSYLPVYSMSDISAQLSFKQRVKSFVWNVYFSLMVDWWMRPRLETIYRERLSDPNLPSIQEIHKSQVSMVFINSHFALTNPRPYLPNILEIGGIHCGPAKPLPKELQEWADSATSGFIVFSMGSIVKASQMPESVRVAFVQAFGKLKEKVIWKWEKDEGMMDLPGNVRLAKWLPQQDLLAHPNVKLFITHGGLLGTEEAAYHGVPVLGMPVFIDQDANMRQAEILGVGVKGEILDLTEAKLTSMIRRILDDPRYATKAKNLAAVFQDQPKSSLEKAVWWTEYVLRHKGAYHMRSPATDLNVLQFHSVDVVALLGVVLVTLLGFVVYVVKSIVKKLVRGTKKSIGGTDKKTK